MTQRHSETPTIMKPWVDPQVCQRCGLCVQECSRHVPLDHADHVDLEHPQCSHCLHCLAVCPLGAIRTSDEPATTADKGTEHLAYQDLLSLLSQRRSHRRFRPEPVPEAVVNQLIEATRYIPSGGARYAQQLTVIIKEETKQALCEQMLKIYSSRHRVLSNPILRTLARPFVDPASRGFLTDPEYRRRFGELIGRFMQGEDPVFYHAPVVVVLHSKAPIPTPREDCVLAGYNLVLSAETLGLGSCFVSMAQNALNSSRTCKEILGLSAKDKVHAVVLVGYPAQTYHRPAPRPLPPVHWC